MGNEVDAIDPARPLDGKVALVAGATRGCGRAIAVELARAGAHVYASGRSSRASGRSEIDRPETIEDTGDLMVAAGGSGTPVVCDHEDAAAVAALVAQIDQAHGRLDILVNDIFGGDRYAQWDTPLWEHDLDGGWRMLGIGVRTHLVTAHHAIPLMLRSNTTKGPGLIIEMTDGTFDFNQDYRTGVGFYYDLVKANVQRIVVGLTHELKKHPITPMAITPGWIRSEAMLENFGVREENWRDALTSVPAFGISESPTYVGRGIAALAADRDAARWAGTCQTSHTLAATYDLTDVDGSRPDAWRLINDYGIDNQDAADVTQYR